MVTKQRPTGVTVLAILALIGGVLAIFGAFGLFAVGALGGLAAAGAAGSGVAVPQATTLAGLSVYLFILGIIALVAGVLDIAFGIGAFRASGWAWMLGIIAELLAVLVGIISIVFGAIQGSLLSSVFSNLIGIAIAVAILYYLNTPNVKAYFGRA